MIKVTVKEVVIANQILNKLKQNYFNGKVAFVLARVIREIQKENEIFELTRMEIINRYADKDEEGNLLQTENGSIHIAEDQLPECNGELSDMLSTAIELNIEPIKEEWLANAELTLEEAIALEPFVV